MSWWDSKGFTSLASQALKTAQKQIDKVLDIDEGASAGGKAKNAGKTAKSAPASKVSSPEAGASAEETNSWNAWSSWMSPKASGSGEKGAEADASQSHAHSSWSFSWGAQEDSSSGFDASSVSLASTGRTSGTVKSSSAPRKLSLSEGDGKQQSISAAGKGRSTSVSETESWRDDESKKDNSAKESGRVPEQTAEGHGEVLQNKADELQEETGTAGSNTSSSPKLDEMSALEKELQSTDTRVVKNKVEVSDTTDSMSSASDQDGATKLAESEASQDSQTSEASDATVLSAASGKAEQAVGDEETQKNAGDVQSVGSDSLGPLAERPQAEVESPLSMGSAGDAPVACDSNASQVFCSLEETFETISKVSHSSETLESFDTAVSGASSVTMASGEASFAQISTSEDLQNTSITSVSSEPVLLSMSTEENSANLTQEDALPDVGPFSPPSHSSLNSEEENEGKSPPFDASCPQDERSSTVCSPQLDSTATASSNDSSETSRLDSSMDTVVDRSQQLHGEEGCEEVDVEAESGKHWLGESSLTDLDASSSPSASFVKCMIEDAMGMEDASKHEDSGSDNHSEEKSESSKVDSEFEKSIYSGHESSDDIETTTSSDIEIISTPTPNGDRNIVDLSPLKFSLQKAARGHAQGHQRSDSQSSSSTHSKGDGDQLSPERDSDHERHDWHREGKDPQQQVTAATDDDLDNPQHPQRLLKSSKNQQEKDVIKKLAEMAEVLQARESKLVQLSKDNNDLLETNSILRSQLQQAEEARESEMTDLNSLTEEFSRRMGESERKMQTILKEKEALKQQLQLAQTELAKRSEDTNLEAVLAEKDEQIKGLMEEGEKLSKQQLQNSNIIKKLRAKEKENEGLIASQKKKVDQQKEELDRLKAVLDSKEDMEKKQADVIKQLNSAVQVIEKEKAKLKVEVDSSDEKIRGLQATLDNSYKEIAELHKSNATQDSRAQQAALSAEMQVREELKMAMEQQKQHHQQEREALIMQIEDLRMSLARMEKDHNRREEMLKQEISDLQMRLQEDESRSQDLTQSVTSATRPLLRQIENLQATHNIQSAAWEKVEKNLTERLTDAQNALAMAQEKERAATEKLTEVSSRSAALEASNSQLRQEKALLTAQLESNRRRIEMLEDRRASDVAQLELAKEKLSEEVANIRKDKVFLESQLEMERHRLEAERQRVAVAEEQIRILERERPRSRGTPSPVSVSRQESMNSSFSEHASTPTLLHRQEEGEGHLMMAVGPKISLYDTMRQSGAAPLVENLHSQLKLKEGEISQLQAEIQQLERTRESMARELVNLTNLNEQLQEEVKELPLVRTNLKELDSRYNALLQMYGEKEEKVQELLLDLEDVKEMYKQQINALMQ